jgi:hypothetical protein
MSESSGNTPCLPGLKWGLDLLTAAVGVKDSYDFMDHALAGLPMIMACSDCETTMAGAGAFIDAEGSCWCGDCAQMRAGV